MTQAHDQSFSLDELATLADLPKRTIRYYIQVGLVPRPDGETRAARYGQDHLASLLSIRKWQRAGLSLERISELLGDAGEVAAVPARRRGAGTVEVWSHLVVADGLELHVEPGQAGLSPEQVRALFREVMTIYENIRDGEEHVE